MVVEYNEFEVELDLDQDIAKRKELIDKAKALSESDDKSVYVELRKIQKEWKKISGFDSILDAQLNEEFDAVVENIYSKRKAEYASNEQHKISLIEKAKSLANPSNFATATKEIEELMNEWRSIGSSGKEVDDELWNKFNTARQTFFDNKKKNWEELQNKFESAKEAKVQLIEKAKTYLDNENLNEASAKLQELLNEWKAIGSAGREIEDKLWNEFDEVRQSFYKKRNDYFDALHERQDKNAVSKKDLVEQARAIADSKSFTKENTEAMKNLSSSWRNVGNSGKQEDGLWAEFREAMDAYFDGMREYNNQRQAEWRQRMKDARARKQELIMNQRRYIKRMQDEMPTMYSQREIDETVELIKEKEDFILQLEKDIADIEEKLNRR